MFIRFTWISFRFILVLAAKAPTTSLNFLAFFINAITFLKFSPAFLLHFQESFRIFR